MGHATGVQLSQRQYASVEVKIVPKVANHGEDDHFHCIEGTFIETTKINAERLEISTW